MTAQGLKKHRVTLAVAVTDNAVNLIMIQQSGHDPGNFLQSNDAFPVERDLMFLHISGKSIRGRTRLGTIQRLAESGIENLFRPENAGGFAVVDQKILFRIHLHRDMGIFNGGDREIHVDEIIDRRDIGIFRSDPQQGIQSVDLHQVDHLLRFERIDGEKIITAAQRIDPLHETAVSFRRDAGHPGDISGSDQDPDVQFAETGKFRIAEISPAFGQLDDISAFDQLRHGPADGAASDLEFFAEDRFAGKQFRLGSSPRNFMQDILDDRLDQ